jgi:hypothetical protein
LARVFPCDYHVSGNRYSIPTKNVTTIITVVDKHYAAAGIWKRLGPKDEQIPELVFRQKRPLKEIADQQAAAKNTFLCRGIAGGLDSGAASRSARHAR